MISNLKNWSGASLSKGHRPTSSSVEAQAREQVADQVDLSGRTEDMAGAVSCDLPAPATVDTSKRRDPVALAPVVLMVAEALPLSAGPAPIPVHRLSSVDSPELKTLVDSFPETAVFRIINEHFVETALRTGTDKGDVETKDLRRLTGEGGYDVWGVEAGLAEKGLTRADVMCATPQAFFLDDGKTYSTAGLGLPADRSAILVFDGNQLTPIEDTDGYRFNDPPNKKAALLGVIRFPKALRPFEQEMEMSPVLADKVAILEREVRHGLQRAADLEDRGDLLSVLVTNNLYDAPNGPDADRLKTLAKDLKERSFLIPNWDNLQSQLDSAANPSDNEPPQRKARRLRQPAFVAKTAREFLEQHSGIPAEFVQRFQKLIADADALAAKLAVA